VKSDHSSWLCASCVKILGSGIRKAALLKHSRASHLVGTMDIALLRQLLGHRDIANTMIYAHATDKAAGKAAMAAEMEVFRGAL
jgi:integrase